MVASIQPRGPAFGGARAQLARTLAPVLMLVLAVLVALSTAAPALAAKNTTVSIKLNAPRTAPIGSEVSVTGKIQRADGKSPRGLRVVLYIGGQYLASARADGAGRIRFTIRGANTEVARDLRLRAAFEGATGISPKSVRKTVTIRPAHISVTTVPAVPGLPISIGDVDKVTDESGMVTFDVDQVGNVKLVPQLDAQGDPLTRISFIRWQDSVYSLARTISVRGDADYVIGLRVAYQGSVDFADLDGQAVDPSLIESARFTSSGGGELSLTSFEDVWWVAATAVSRTGGLQESDTLWRLAEVQMSGANVVHRGQQAYTPTRGGKWTINLLLYDLAIRASDAVTGATIHGPVVLTYPDATTQTGEPGDDGLVRFNALPRGQYTVVVDVAGVSPKTPIALSRSQEAEIRIISALDIAVAALLAVTIPILLYVVGRGVPRVQVTRLKEAGRRGGALTTQAGVAAMSRGRAASDAVRRVPSDLTTVDQGRMAAALEFAGLMGRRSWAEAQWIVARLRYRVAVARGQPMDPPVKPVVSPAHAATSGAGEPTLECPRCHGQVPEGALFCRTCGRLQSSAPKGR